MGSTTNDLPYLLVTEGHPNENVAMGTGLAFRVRHESSHSRLKLRIASKVARKLEKCNTEITSECWNLYSVRPFATLNHKGTLANRKRLRLMASIKLSFQLHIRLFHPY